MNITKLNDKMFGDKLWSARKEAKQWAKANLQGKSLTNKDTGWKIDITGIGIDKALSKERLIPLKHIEAIRAIPELIENAALSETRPDRDNDPHIKNIHIFYAPLEIDGKLHSTKITVKEFDDGNCFYDHSLTKIEKPTGSWAEDTFAGSASRPPQQASTISLKDLLKNVKTSKDN
ncbi:MAG: hypothetical protein HQK96_11435 [Nitrospirae bacterium]|nr:hypothetical protein [Nitrospirota bacterium]